MTLPITHQFPLRMPATLAEELTLASASTGINKSEICRMGIARILQDLKQTAVAAEMAKFRNNKSKAGMSMPVAS